MTRYGLIVAALLLTPYVTADELNGPQRNAVRIAEEYLEIDPFSRKGLIKQLSEGEGFEKDNAEIAVDSLQVDWKANAARSASLYTEMGGFSCESLRRQLSSPHGEHFTPGQARHGASQTSACQ